MKTRGDCSEYNVARLEVTLEGEGREKKNMTFRQPCAEECLMRKVNKIRKVPLSNGYNKIHNYYNTRLRLAMTRSRLAAELEKKNYFIIIILKNEKLKNASRRCQNT